MRLLAVGALLATGFVGTVSASSAELALRERELDVRERELGLRERELALQEAQWQAGDGRAGGQQPPQMMSSFGVAIKHGVACGPDAKETTIFEHTVSAGATHGVITSMWHGGTHGDLRMRVYVDDEFDRTYNGDDGPAVDYTVSLAHGLAPEDNQT